MGFPDEPWRVIGLQRRKTVRPVGTTPGLLLSVEKKEENRMCPTIEGVPDGLVQV